MRALFNGTTIGLYVNCLHIEKKMEIVVIILRFHSHLAEAVDDRNH